MKKKLYIIAPLVLITSITLLVFYFLFFHQKLSHSINKVFPQELIIHSEMYEDLSKENPLEGKIDLSNPHHLEDISNGIEKRFVSSKKGIAVSSVDQCGNDGYCVGAYAAQHKDQSICESYPFKSKYLSYPMCYGGCGNQRGSFDGNSAYENCFIGYGITNKNQSDCENLPQSENIQNVPDYDDDRSSSLKIKRESCLYGTAIGKNNIDACETSSYFQNSCYSDFAQINKSTDLCSRIDNKEQQSRCLMIVAPIEGNIEACMRVEKINKNVQAFSNTQSEINHETEDRDNCILGVVETQKLTDKAICDKITSIFHKNLCRQKVAVQLKDPSLCNISFLGSQGNVDGCINMLAKSANDISLCQKASRPSYCIEMFNFNKK